jgi:hypothetical protein
MKNIIHNPLILLYFTLVLLFISGFGILFMNEETILSISFFIFMSLIIQNSDGLSKALDEQIEAIRSELLTSLIEGQQNAVLAKVLINHQKHELASGLEKVFKDCDFKINQLFTCVKTSL